MLSALATVTTANTPQGLVTICHVHFTLTSSFDSPYNNRKCYDYPHFIDGKIEAQRAVNLLQIVQHSVALGSELLQRVKRVRARRPSRSSHLWDLEVLGVPSWDHPK